MTAIDEVDEDDDRRLTKKMARHYGKTHDRWRAEIASRRRMEQQADARRNAPITLPKFKCLEE